MSVADDNADPASAIAPPSPPDPESTAGVDIPADEPAIVASAPVRADEASPPVPAAVACPPVPAVAAAASLAAPPADAVPHTAFEQLAHDGDYCILGASLRGRSHQIAGTFREDAFALAGGNNPAPWFFIAVADGAGSCRLSRVGADVATRTAARYARERVSVDTPAAELVDAAARAAFHAQLHVAAERGLPVAEFSSTLLLLFWIGDGAGGGRSATFQAGDGMIATVDERHQFELLAAGDDETPGYTHFLAGRRVTETWASRTTTRTFARRPHAFVVMSDGVADDLIPLARNGPIIGAEIARIACLPEPEAATLAMLAYEKRGSFDDRTIAIAWSRDPAGAAG